MSEEKYLTMDEYCRLFAHITLAEYDNLFLNAELRRDLGLDKDQTRRFAVEYLCAALYLLDDLLPDSRLPDEVCRAVSAQVRGQVFRSILPKTAPEGAEAPYILYSLKRAAAFAPFYARGDETMRQLIDNCLDQAKLTDPVARMPQSFYLMNLLPGVVQLYCDLVCGVALDTAEPLRFRIVLPQAEQNGAPADA